jgi:glycine cleavage system H protein
MSQLRFSDAHVWVRIDDDLAVLGLSEYLQDQMGEITSLKLPDLGDVLRAKRRMGHVESDDASSPLEAPVSGEVVEVNPDVLENPDIVNAEPYGSGWLIKVRLDDSGELEDLISEEEYAELTTEV